MKRKSNRIILGLFLTTIFFLFFGVKVNAENEFDSTNSDNVVFSPENSEYTDTTPQSRAASPVWRTDSFTVTKNGRSVTATWKIKTNATIYRVNAVYNTGVLGQTTSPGTFYPNSGGVSISQTWRYNKAGTYRINGVAQIYTSKGNANCFSPVRVVSIN